MSFMDQWVAEIYELLRGANETVAESGQGDCPIRAPEAMPFRIRDDFLSPAENCFHEALRHVVQDRAVICPKVRLSDVFFIVERYQNPGLANKLDRKHIDFLLCSKESVKPLAAIELDDRSHQREDRKARDLFVNQVFAAAGLSLVRIPCQRRYDLKALSQQLEPVLSAEPLSTPIPYATEEAAVSPTCPKCGIPMVTRKTRSGARAGKTFFGCRNFPACREVIGEWH